MTDSIRIKYYGAVPGKSLTRRVLSGMIREAWQEVGHHWHREMMPKHFSKSASREYGYSPRAGEPGNERKKFWTSYTGRKARKFGHRDPLVYTGELREMARAYRLSVTATSSRSKLRIVMPMANKANFRNKYSTINMRDELTRVSESEARALVALHDAAMQRQLDAHHATHSGS